MYRLPLALLVSVLSTPCLDATLLNVLGGQPYGFSQDGFSQLYYTGGNSPVVGVGTAELDLGTGGTPVPINVSFITGPNLGYQVANCSLGYYCAGFYGTWQGASMVLTDSNTNATLLVGLITDPLVFQKFSHYFYGPMWIGGLQWLVTPAFTQMTGFSSLTGGSLRIDGPVDGLGFPLAYENASGFFLDTSMGDLPFSVQDIVATPEPSGIVLLFTGVMLFALHLRRRTKRKRC